MLLYTNLLKYCSDNHPVRVFRGVPNSEKNMQLCSPRSLVIPVFDFAKAILTTTALVTLRYLQNKQSPILSMDNGDRGLLYYIIHRNR